MLPTIPYEGIKIHSVLTFFRDNIANAIIMLEMWLFLDSNKQDKSNSCPIADH